MIIKLCHTPQNRWWHIIRPIRFIIVMIAIFLIIIDTKTVCALDLTLEQAIRFALKNNIGLQTEQLELENTISEVTIKKADYIPKLSSTLSQTHNEDYLFEKHYHETNYIGTISQKIPLGGELSFSYDTYFQEQNDIYSSELKYTQAILKNGLFAPSLAEIKTADYDRQIKEIESLDLRIKLIRDVKSSFYRTLQLQNTIAVYGNILQISENVSALVRSRFNIGFAPELDVMQADIEKTRIQEALLELRQQLETAGNELKNLLNTNETIRAIDEQGPPLFPLEQHATIAAAINQNQGLVEIQRTIEKQELAVKVARNKTLPQADLFASLKKTRQNNPWGSDEYLYHREYQVGLIVSYPLLNKGFTESYRKEERTLERLKLNRIKMENEITNAVAMIVKQLQYLEDRINVMEKQVEIIKTRMDLTLKAFDKGLININRIFDARNDLLEAENLALLIHLEKSKKWAELQQLLGMNF